MFEELCAFVAFRELAMFEALRLLEGESQFEVFMVFKKLVAFNEEVEIK